jgi:carbonic anhydrase
MSDLKILFENNKKWAEETTKQDPDFFQTLSKQHTPEYLWIGCSDSRVPANQIVGLLPGEIFVHRNIANVVVHTDLNCLSVIQFAVDVLEVKHIIVCGHYGCGGVNAALEKREHGLIDNWLRHIKDVYRIHQSKIDVFDSNQHRSDKLCELNVFEQVANVCHTTIVQNAWKRGRDLTVHGWIYSLEDGLIRDLGISISDNEQIKSVYRMK